MPAMHFEHSSTGEGHSYPYNPVPHYYYGPKHHSISLATPEIKRATK